MGEGGEILRLGFVNNCRISLIFFFLCFIRDSTRTQCPESHTTRPTVNRNLFLAKLWTGTANSVGEKTAGGGGADRVLCLHGYQDNCGSFDRLIPALADGGEHRTYLSFDWPNHGRSSGTPYGVRWSLENYVVTVRRVVEHVRWWPAAAFTVVGHSMGGQVAKLFAAVYPECVAKLVMLDAAGPEEVDPEEVACHMQRASDYLLKFENRMVTKHPTPRVPHSVALARIKNRMYDARSGERLSDDAARALMVRYYRQPESGGDYLVLANDVRLKVAYSEWFTAQQFSDVVRKIKCPTLHVKASEYEEFVYDSYKFCFRLYEQNPNFQMVFVQGNHDVHMNHPHRVASLINKFLNNNNCKL